MNEFHVLTLFPEIIRSYSDASILGRAAKAGIISVAAYNIRDYSSDRHKKTDDYPYSGGGGMIMTPQPVFEAYDFLRELYGDGFRSVYMSPKGRTLNNEIIREYSECPRTVILCGRYEGVDQRIIDTLIDDEISLGDYVLTGGELPALVFIDAVSRFVEGVLSNGDTSKNESHYNGLLEYPQYTRPSEFRGMKVPEILLSGNEALINKWKRLMSIKLTKDKRPDINILSYASANEIEEAENIGYLFTQK